MSIQFRSRIKPAFNYSDTLNSYGYCCDSKNPSIPKRKSFLECFNEGGYFIATKDNQVPTCPNPEAELGCCCACTYVTFADRTSVPRYNSEDLTNQYFASGIMSQVSKCSCDRIGGKWTAGPCPTQGLDAANLESLCVVDGKDVREPKSCCHLRFESDSGWPIGIGCTDVCSSFECAQLGTETYPSVYGESTTSTSTRCTISPIADCAGSDIIPRLASSTNNATPIIEQNVGKLFRNVSTRKYAPGFNPYKFNPGSCYQLTKTGSDYDKYDCSFKSQTDCLNGWWVERQNNVENPYCKNYMEPTPPVKVNGFYDVQRMSVSSFEALGVTAGDRFQGGIYIGIFETPHSGSSSLVLGDLSFGQPILSKFESDGIGSRTDTKWALIVENNLIYTPFINQGEEVVEYETSLYDGYYNTYGDNSSFRGIQTALTNTIRYNLRNGFIDYYIPSILELNFYAAYLQKINLSYDLGFLVSSSYFNTKYLGSSIKTSKFANNASFNYAQAISSLSRTKYSNVLVDKNTFQNIMLFRRIVLTD